MSLLNIALPGGAHTPPNKLELTIKVSVIYRLYGDTPLSIMLSGYMIPPGKKITKISTNLNR